MAPSPYITSKFHEERIKMTEDKFFECLIEIKKSHDLNLAITQSKLYDWHFQNEKNYSIDVV